MLITEIDTRQGTNNSRDFSHGNCLPYVGVPFAMNYYSVQTNGDAGNWFFNPYDHRFEGIRLTHQPSPWIGDYNQVLFTAVSGEEIFTEDTDYAGTYDGKSAIFEPAYQRIFDERYQTQTEVIPTIYGARFTFSNLVKKTNKLVIRSKAIQSFFYDSKNSIFYFSIRKSNNNSSRLTMYVAMDAKNELDVSNSGYWNDKNQWQTQLNAKEHIKSVILAFLSSTTEISVATSYLSFKQANINLARIKNQSSEELQCTANHQWQEYFNRITIEDENNELIQTFYTCLYRLFLFPQRFYEEDENGISRHFDMYSQKERKGILFTNNGLWDTSKTVFPLFSIIAPEILPDILTGFLQSYHESGYLPKWLAPDELGMMPGTLVDSVIADAAIKGIGSKLMPKLLTGMLKSATVPSNDNRFGRSELNDYLHYGYVPTDANNESVNSTLDYAYSDFCIAQVARTVGNQKVANFYSKQSKNYQNLFNKKMGLMIGKNSKGQSSDFFTSDTWGYSYTEGSAWQNSFSVYHDIPGLVKLYGGKDAFNRKLTKLCNTDPTFKVGSYKQQIHEMTEMANEHLGQLAISNQPSFHIPYLFNYAGHPENTQILIKQIRKFFNSSPEGFPGDEDNGSMSGWFIFSCLGFYPVCPGNAEYVLGIPGVNKIVLKLASGKTFTINTHHNDSQNNFVRSRSLNQKTYSNLYITHKQLLEGGNFDTTLCLLPSSKPIAESALPH